eukprot:g44572.t1
MNRKIHSLLKSKSEAFKLGDPDLNRKSRGMSGLIFLIFLFFHILTSLCIKNISAELPIGFLVHGARGWTDSVTTFQMLGSYILNIDSSIFPTTDIYVAGQVMCCSCMVWKLADPIENGSDRMCSKCWLLEELWLKIDELEFELQTLRHIQEGERYLDAVFQEA